jgi:outer membrane protein insertion porin family
LQLHFALEKVFGNRYLSLNVASAPKYMRNRSPLICFLILCSLASYVGFTQETLRSPGSVNLADAPLTILDVRIEGNIQKSSADIIKLIKTRPDRPFNKTVLEEDKRTLIQKTWFIDVKTKVDRTPEGYIVTFQCIERQLINFIKVVGNKTHTKKILLEEANINVGDALDPIAVHQAKERMAQFYRESGYHQVFIEVVIGDELGDRGIIFRISEGPKQRILSVEFEGNTIATSSRLKTLIESKPGFFFWFNSDFTRKKLDDDLEILTNYYRKLGFFYAKIDRVFVETQGYSGMGANRGWVKVKFIIDEGPQCKIRNITFVDNKAFSQEALLKKMKLAGKKNQYYNQDMLEIDMQSIKDLYGNEGYTFAMPSPDPRVEQDYVDLVITIREGPRCYLETLDVEIRGRDNSESYTKWHPVLNRSSIRPGDLLRTNEINATKRRLYASQLFNSNPSQGAMPEFIFEYPKAALEAEAAEKEAEMQRAENPQYRGQAPQPPSMFNHRLIPRKLAEPDIQLAPPNRTFIPAAPQAIVTDGTYRGQTPASPAPTFYTPPPVPNQSVYTTQPSAQKYVPNSGSVAPAPTPLQDSSPAAIFGMSSTQFRETEPAAILRANPYDTLHASAPVKFDPNAPPGASPYIYPVPGKIVLQEAQTGSIMLSLAVSSDAGLMGRFVYDEQNFDILNAPKGFRLSDWKNAYRGRGQRFRVEAMPGTQVQRYSAGWETPFWLDLDYSFGVNGFYYQRYYSEWNEDRLGGSLTFGKLWTQDISTRLSLGAQNVNIYRGAIPVPELIPGWSGSVIGKHPMYNIGLEAIYNTRDSEYMPTEGHMISAKIEQVLGDYQFLRGNIDLRKYFMLRERPDRSGRWVLGLRSSLGVTEGGTPIFERFFGGGFTNLRGFEFRGVSPRTDQGYVMGGCMEFYNSAEVIFPLTADDMIRGSVFIDTGTVESSATKWNENYRVAMGFGLRLTIPMMGPAPIALDFAFPISSAKWDDKQVFSFGMSFLR